MDATAQSIEDLLFSQGTITSDQLNLVKLESANTGKSAILILKDRGFAQEPQIVAAKAEIIGIPTIDIASRMIQPDLLTLIPQPIADRYTVIPFELDDKTNVLSVAMADPLDLTITDYLEKKTGKKVRPYLSSALAIREAIAERYPGNLSSEVTAALAETGVLAGKPAAGAAGLGADFIRDTPVAKIVERLMEFAVRERASDIHIEPLEDRTRIRFRIDGILHDESVLPVGIHESVISRIKIMSGMKIDEKRIPQDGRFDREVDGTAVDVRVSTLPTVHGEKVVLRLLRKTGGIPPLSELGLRGTALKNLEIAILRPHGIIVICGPTGSGKTTTLYSVLSKINSSKVNIVTIEDPVEYYLPGVNQVQINPQAGLTFATGLRSFLRQDPNIILVGEIRDRETTDLAIQAALTGHLVFSTLHTSSAAGAIPRFLDLGGEPFLLASSLNALLGQRILRRICPHCKESYQAAEAIEADIRKVLGAYLPKEKQTGKIELFRGRGCDECGDSGFIGRIGIFEVLPVTDRIGKLVLSHADAAEIENLAVEEGMVTMKQDGYLKALEGITTIEEVLRVAQD